MLTTCINSCRNILIPLLCQFPPKTGLVPVLHTVCAFTESDAIVSQIWFHIANICYIAAILSDVILVLGNSTWDRTFWAELFPYPIIIPLLLGMMKPANYFNAMIALFYILVRIINYK